MSFFTLSLVKYYLTILAKSSGICDKSLILRTNYVLLENENTGMSDKQNL